MLGYQGIIDIRLRVPPHTETCRRGIAASHTLRWIYTSPRGAHGTLIDGFISARAPTLLDFVMTPLYWTERSFGLRALRQNCRLGYANWVTSFDLNETIVSLVSRARTESYHICLGLGPHTMFCRCHESSVLLYMAVPRTVCGGGQPSTSAGPDRLSSDQTARSSGRCLRCLIIKLNQDFAAAHTTMV